MDKYVVFHGEISWYTLDCYPSSVQKKLKKLPISTYSVCISSNTIHYFSWQLPKMKDFFPYEFTCGSIYPHNASFFKELRKYIRKSRYFNESKTTIAKAKALVKGKVGE